MAAPSFSLSRTQLRWLEWLALSALLLGLVAWASLREQPRVINTFVQDITGWLSAPAPRDDIVIVAIDDASLQSVGRWPWRRSVHAQLIARIAAQHPKALGVDVLFSEPDLQHPEDDAQLAQAIAQAGNVVLPVDWRMANVDIGAELPLAIPHHRRAEFDVPLTDSIDALALAVIQRYQEDTGTARQAA